MNRTEYERTKARLTQEVHDAHAEAHEAQKAGAAAREKINRKNEAIAALERVWREFAPPEPPTEGVVLFPARSSEGRTWAEVVREAVYSMPIEFNTQALIGRVFEIAPDRPDNNSNRATISGTVKRMEEANPPVLVLVERGTGAKPSLYRKINGHAVASPEASKEASDTKS